VKKWLGEESAFWDPIFVDRLIKSGEKVICLDNFFIGSKENIEHFMGPPSFELIHHQVTYPINLDVNRINI
tara:strand:- start:13 stop:225 length:213 start_codon:yes stop_codon:yes gene_type:complete